MLYMYSTWSLCIILTLYLLSFNLICPQAITDFLLVKMIFLLAYLSIFVVGTVGNLLVVWVVFSCKVFCSNCIKLFFFLFYRKCKLSPMVPYSPPPLIPPIFFNSSSVHCQSCRLGSARLFYLNLAYTHLHLHWPLDLGQLALLLAAIVPGRIHLYLLTVTDSHCLGSLLGKFT